MRTHGKSQASGLTLPRASKGGQDFDYGQPFELDIGRAALIAEALRECGYAGCTADVVTTELARPDPERSIIGRFAADQLARAGWRP
jgi:hypothetical protein